MDDPVALDDLFRPVTDPDEARARLHAVLDMLTDEALIALVLVTTVKCSAIITCN
jgi:hypothetical protein